MGTEQGGSQWSPVRVPIRYQSGPNRFPIQTKRFLEFVRANQGNGLVWDWEQIGHGLVLEWDSLLTLFAAYPFESPRLTRKSRIP